MLQIVIAWALPAGIQSMNRSDDSGYWNLMRPAKNSP